MCETFKTCTTRNTDTLAYTQHIQVRLESASSLIERIRYTNAVPVHICIHTILNIHIVVCEQAAWCDTQREATKIIAYTHTICSLTQYNTPNTISTMSYIWCFAVGQNSFFVKKWRFIWLFLFHFATQTQPYEKKSNSALFVRALCTMLRCLYNVSELLNFHLVAPPTNRISLCAALVR